MIRKKLFLEGSYLPDHRLNRMRSEGDVASARNGFTTRRFLKLDYLLASRYGWMNDFLQQGWRVVEIGAGAGFSEFYLKLRPMLTDFVPHPWVDAPLDALDMALPDRSVDCLIASHNIHHFASSHRFFRECERVLKPGGCLLVQEVNTSLALRALLRLMRHEGWSNRVDVFAMGRSVAIRKVG
jgi:SAM-dependent methyltransferase